MSNEDTRENWMLATSKSSAHWTLSYCWWQKGVQFSRLRKRLLPGVSMTTHFQFTHLYSQVRGQGLDNVTSKVHIISLKGHLCNIGEKLILASPTSFTVRLLQCFITLLYYRKYRWVYIPMRKRNPYNNFNKKGSIQLKHWLSFLISSQ